MLICSRGSDGAAGRRPGGRLPAPLPAGAAARRRRAARAARGAALGGVLHGELRGLANFFADPRPRGIHRNLQKSITKPVQKFYMEFTVLWQVVSIGSGPLSISMVQVLPVAPRRAAAAGRGAPDAARAAPSRRPGERVGREVRGRAAGLLCVLLLVTQSDGSTVVLVLVVSATFSANYRRTLGSRQPGKFAVLCKFMKCSWLKALHLQ